jgi:hypothetical protein
MRSTTTTGQTAAVNGMQTYYEVHGQGEPPALLHGFAGAGGNRPSFVGGLTIEYQHALPPGPLSFLRPAALYSFK